VLLESVDQSWQFQGLLVIAAGLVAGFTILWSLAPRRERFVAPGVRLQLQEQPRLAALIEETARALGEGMPDQMYLTPDVNAFVTERGGLFGFRSQRIMGVGLPLLAALSVSELRGILAHEFAHFYAGDARLGPRMYRTRLAMARVVRNLTGDNRASDFVRRFGYAGFLHYLVGHILTAYWKVFLRVTQWVARQQEHRSDELACYLAGKSAFVGGLGKLPGLTSAYGWFWSTGVAPVLARKYRPPIADGYARVLQEPSVALMRSQVSQQVMKQDRTNAYDTHPPLKARIKRVEKIGSAAAWPQDDSPALGLVNGIDDIEQQLIERLTGAKDFRKVDWEEMAELVYLPGWRELVNEYKRMLAGVTIDAVPDLLARLPQWAGNIRDPQGMLLTREQRTERAASLVWTAMTLRMTERGWELRVRPGFWELKRSGEATWPAALVAKLRKGEMTREAWLAWCNQNQLTGVGLADD
jgi:heat shock protein HtpX